MIASPSSGSIDWIVLRQVRTLTEYRCKHYLFEKGGEQVKQVLYLQIHIVYFSFFLFCSLKPALCDGRYRHNDECNGKDWDNGGSATGIITGQILYYDIGAVVKGGLKCHTAIQCEMPLKW